MNDQSRTHETSGKLGDGGRRMKFEARRAGRRLLRAPAFSISVVLLLAIGIGGTAAVATAAYELFLRPLPYQEPDRLVTLGVHSNRMGFRMGLSAALVEELEEDGGFGELGIAERSAPLQLEDGDAAAGRIDHRIADVMGIAPLAGRTFTAVDVAAGAEPVALISERYWQQRFAGERDAIGRMLTLRSGDRVRIVGVLPEAFALPASDTEIWRPMRLDPETTGAANVSSFGNLTVVARLREDVSADALSDRLDARLEADERLQGLAAMLEADYRVEPLRELWASGQAQGLALLGGALALLLVASLLNLSGLWMARWFGRSRELAVQTALGGTRRSVFVGALLEYAWLAVPALALAMLVAHAALALLLRLNVVDEAGPLTADTGAATIAIGTVLLVVGVLPILAALAWQLRGITRNGFRFLTGGGTASASHGALLRRGLVAGQIAVAFGLITAFWLLLSSWNNLLRQDLGFEPDRLLLARIAMPSGRETSPESEPDPRVAALIDRLAGLPGVSTVSWANAVPFGGIEMISDVQLDGDAAESIPARPRQIGTGYLETAGIRLIEGRTFEEGTESSNEVLIDRLFAERHFGGDALGRSFSLGSQGDERRPVTVIGVTETVRHMSLDKAVSTPTFYVPQSEPHSQAQLLVRTDVPPATLVEKVRSTAEGIVGPDRVGQVATIESSVRRIVRDREPQLVLMGAFAGLALVLVAYGLYALQSYQVAARKPELGMRMAMGASGRRLLAELVGGAMRLVLPGLALGALFAWASSSLVSSRLFEVSAVSPAVWAGSAVALTVVVALAALMPGLRAARISPMDALRHD
ncbi:MAG: ABC transporter permease [Candidatus Wenzhouxiangella sp. M2_3B_020]